MLPEAKEGQHSAILTPARLSPPFCQVINTARNAAFVLVTVTLIGEEASTLQCVGYSVSLAAFSAYTYFKVNKM